MEKQSPSRRGGYLEALLNSCPDAIIATNAEGIVTFANKEAARLTERELHELVGESIVTVYENLDRARETNRKLHMSGGIIRDHESVAKTKSGKLVPIRVSASHLKDSADNYIGAVGFFQTYRPWTAEETKVKAYAEKLEAELEEWKELGAPIFDFYPNLGIARVVGRLDAARFEHVSQNLLNHVKKSKSRVVLIDFTASLVGDGSIASQLLKTIRTLQLLGAHCILSGIQTSVAQAMESLVADVTSIESYASIDAALVAALNYIGYTICEKES